MLSDAVELQNLTLFLRKRNIDVFSKPSWTQYKLGFNYPCVCNILLSEL